MKWLAVSLALSAAPLSRQSILSHVMVNFNSSELDNNHSAINMMIINQSLLVGRSLIRV